MMVSSNDGPLYRQQLDARERGLAGETAAQQRRELDQELALEEAYLVCRGNIFWQAFLGEISRRAQYCHQRLGQATSWEEVCRLQGGLSVCQQLLAAVESRGKEREA